MNKVIPWYKIYDFVKSQPQDRDLFQGLKFDYLVESDAFYDIAKRGSFRLIDYEYDTTLSNWDQTAKDLKTFGQIKESMDQYMDDQFRESGFEVYIP